MTKPKPKSQHKKPGPKGASKYSKTFIREQADKLIEYANLTPVPFLSDFAPKQGYHAQRLSEWARDDEKNPELSDALKRFKDIQKYKLMIGGLAGKLNPSMCIFTLKNVAGFRDQVEHTGKMEHEHFLKDVIRRSREVGDEEDNRSEAG